LEHEIYRRRKPISAEVLDPPLPISGELFVGSEESLDPAENLGFAQLERGGPVGVKAPAHVAELVSAFLERGDPIANKCDHCVLVAQSQILQLLEPFVDLVRQDGGLLGDLVPEIRIRRTRSVGAQPNQIFSCAISDIK